MNRRDFVIFSAAWTAAFHAQQKALAAAAGLLPNATLEYPANAAAQAAPQHSNRKADVRVTSEFMEEYVPGRPWAPPTRQQGPLQVPYVASDGSFQFFTYFNWATANSIVRLYPSADSITGWDQQTIPLPQDVINRNAFAPPQVVIVPGASGEPDTLWLYRTLQFFSATIAPDGTVGPMTLRSGKQRTTPLLAGQMPAGIRYMLEVVSRNDQSQNNYSYDPSPTSQTKRGYILRDLANPSFTYPIDPTAFSYAESNDNLAMEGVQLFPLKDTAENYFRCALMTSRGDAFYILLTLDKSDPKAPIFRVRDKQLLGNSKMHCVYLHEETPGKFDLILMDLPTGLYVTGKYEPGATTKMTSDYAWTGNKRFTLPKFDDKILQPNREWSMLGTWNQYKNCVELFLLSRDTTKTDGLFDVYTTTRMSDLSWEPLAPLDYGCASIATFAAKGLAVLLSKPGIGFEVFVRNEHGEWDSDYVRLPSEGTEMTQIAGYRVGVNLSVEKVPLGGETVSITCSQPSVVVIGDRQSVLGKNRATRMTTDSSGVAWFTVIMENRLCFPSVTVSSPRLTQDFSLDLNQKVENFFVGINEDTLKNAKDRKSGESIAKKPENIGSAVASIRSLMEHERDQHTYLFENTHPLQSDVPARWVPKHSAIPAVYHPDREHPHFRNTRVNFAADNCWCFEVVDGVARYEKLTREELQFRVAALRLTAQPEPPPPGLFDFLDDVFDGLANIANTVWDGVGKVTHAIFEGAKFVLNVVIDGLNFIIDGVLDTIERVMDAVCLLLDAAGFILGMAINWILEQLGFLFDWPLIKRRRTQMKTLLSDNAGLLSKIIPDPALGAKYLVSKLDDLRGWLLQYRSSDASAKTYGSKIASFPSLPEIFSVADVTVLPQVTWLMDKIAARLAKNFSSATLDFPALAEAQGKSLQKLVETGNRLNISLDDIQTLVVSWITNADVFSDSAFRPLLDLVLSKLDLVLQLIRDVAETAGEVLHQLWLSPEKIIAWFDSTINIPFLGGFYRGLTEHNLSLLDVLCLLTSINTVATHIPIPDAENFPGEELPFPGGHIQFAESAHATSGIRLVSFSRVGEKTTSFPPAALSKTGKVAGGFALAAMAIGTQTAAMDAFFVATGRSRVIEKGDSSVATLFGGFNVAVNICAAISLTILAAETGDAIAVGEVTEICVPILAGFGLFLAFTVLPLLDAKFFPGIQERQGYSRGVLTDVLLNGLNVYFLVSAIVKKNDLGIARTTLSLTQSAMMATVRQVAERSGKGFLPPYGPFVVGGLVGALSVARMGIFAAQYDKLLNP